MPAWLFLGTRQRTKRLEKSDPERDTRIYDSSAGSLQTIETGSVSPIAVKMRKNPRLRLGFGVSPLSSCPFLWNNQIGRGARMPIDQGHDSMPN
jgi:hypothetical protein